MSTLKVINLQHPNATNNNITIDNNNNVFVPAGNAGFATTNSQNTLDLGTGTNGRGITWGGTDGTNQYTSIWTPYSLGGLVLATGYKPNTASDSYLSSYNSGYLYRNAIRLDAFDSNGIRFFTDTPASSAPGTTLTPTERMRINSSGYVTKPYQPFFMGYPTTDYSSGSMPTQTMAVTAYFNNANCFNGSTNRFTCPVTGWYRVTWGGLQLASTVTSLQVNGSDVHNGNHYAGSYPSYITMTQTIIRQQAAGDYFTIRQWNGGGYYSAWWLWTVELVG